MANCGCRSILLDYNEIIRSGNVYSPGIRMGGMIGGVIGPVKSGRGSMLAAHDLSGFAAHDLSGLCFTCIGGEHEADGVATGDPDETISGSV